MVQLLVSAGYNLGGGKMGVDTYVKNDDVNSFVVAIDFLSIDATPKHLGRMSVCIPPGCSNIRGEPIILVDPYKAIVYRCISIPNCGMNSCSTFSSIADSAVFGEVMRWDGIRPTLPLYTVPACDYYPPTPPTILITNLRLQPVQSQWGWSIDVFWEQNVGGIVKVIVDGIVKLQQTYLAGPNSTTIPAIANKTYNICIEGG